MKNCVAAVVGFLLLSACTIGSGKPVTLTQVPIPNVTGTASFDAVEIDQKAHRLYAADRTSTGIDVFDLSSTPASYAKTIALASYPNGLAFAPDLNRLYAGLADGSVAIIDQNDKVIAQVATGGKLVDLIDYSPTEHEVYASLSRESAIARIDAVTGELKGTIKVTGFGLEQPRYNSTDHTLYVTSPDAGMLFAIDPKTGSIKSKIDLGGCQARGLAINPTLDQALVACRTWVERFNLRDPLHDAQSFEEITGADLITYDAPADLFLVATPDANPSGVSVLGGNPIRFVAAVHSRTGGNAAALDEQHGVVFTPDTRAGKAGMVAFNLPTGEPAVSIDSSAILELAAVIAAVVLVMIVIGRLADPIRRPDPLPRRRRA